MNPNSKLSVKEIKQKLSISSSVEVEFLEKLQKDTRSGVQAILRQWEKKQQKEQIKLEKFQQRLSFERNLWEKGIRLVAGIDEVGRGPLAGPVVAAAVILSPDFFEIEVNDSKQLSLAKREELFQKIEDEAISIGIGIIDNEKIDEVNIYEATKLAMIQAIENLDFFPEYLLIDAMKLPVSIPQENLIKGDSRSVSIAAASIIAKVTRDKMMSEYAKIYPEYSFNRNAGYGTKEHLKGIDKNGICPIHRKSFAPIKYLTK